MKRQFNLDEYNRLVAEGKTPKIITGSEQSVRILCTDAKGDLPIIALITEDKEEDVWRYYPTGRISTNGIDDLDLFFTPEKKEGWIVVSNHQAVYATREEAEKHIPSDLDFTAAHIDWEE